MYIALVVGRIWADHKNENYEGVPLLIVQPLNENYEKDGEPEIAADALGCCEGEHVWVEGGKEACYALPTTYGPSDASIVAKIDYLDVSVPAPTDRPVRLVGERGGQSRAGAPSGTSR